MHRQPLPVAKSTIERRCHLRTFGCGHLPGGSEKRTEFGIPRAATTRGNDRSTTRLSNRKYSFAVYRQAQWRERTDFFVRELRRSWATTRSVGELLRTLARSARPGRRRFGCALRLTPNGPHSRCPCNAGARSSRPCCWSSSPPPRSIRGVVACAGPGPL